MPRLTIHCRRSQLRQMNRFVVDRIPNRSGWSIAHGAPQKRALNYTWAEQDPVQEYVYWFAKRHASVGFELKLNYG